jgi:GNAT superfamily N-acetyltransferase
MRTLRETYFQEDSNKEVQKIGNDEIVVNTFSVPGGKIVVWENSPYAGGDHSIFSFVVDESRRGVGIGSKLIGMVLKEYPGVRISGQVSGLASLKVLHNKGFTNAEKPGASFEELVETFHDNGGSIRMVSNI